MGWLQAKLARIAIEALNPSLDIITSTRFRIVGIFIKILLVQSTSDIFSLYVLKDIQFTV
jgi:hypothetical protein